MHPYKSSYALLLVLSCINTCPPCITAYPLMHHCLFSQSPMHRSLSSRSSLPVFIHHRLSIMSVLSCISITACFLCIAGVLSCIPFHPLMHHFLFPMYHCRSFMHPFPSSHASLPVSFASLPVIHASLSILSCSQPVSHASSSLVLWFILPGQKEDILILHQYRCQFWLLNFALVPGVL